MKHRSLIALALIAAFLLGQLSHAAAPSIRLPIVGAQIAQGAKLDKLVDRDCGFVSALSIDGRFFVGYQTRPDGHVHIAEDLGDRLVDVADPALAQTLRQLVAPSFDLPGPKQGSLSMVADGQYIRAYFTGRAADDPSGPFYVWRYRFPVPARPT